MQIRRLNIIQGALLVLVFIFSISCADRFPFFIQQPEFIEKDPGDGYPGILLTIQCEDDYAVIRYTDDGTTPNEYHGIVYKDPIYLLSQSVYIQAVAVRAGYPAGPVGEYWYEP